MSENKTINTKATIDISDNLYTLEYDRATIKYLERVLKCNIMEYTQSFITTSLEIWQGGFQKHHKEIPLDERERLYDQYQSEGGDLLEVINLLSESIIAFAPTTQSDTPIKKRAIIE